MAKKWYPQLGSEDYSKPDYGRMHKGKAQVKSYSQHVKSKSKALESRKGKKHFDSMMGIKRDDKGKINFGF